MFKRFHLVLLVAALACAAAVAPVSLRVTQAADASGTATASNAASATGEAERALDAGAALLRRNRADEALPLLESALKLFTQANDGSGAAAAHAALGELYLRYGQYTTALEHFGHAAEGYRAQKEMANAALMFAKLGETHYLAGDETSARAAFARLGETPEVDAQNGGSTVTASGGGNNSRRREGGSTGASFAAISSLLPGLGSCPSFNQQDTEPMTSATNNAPGNLASNVNAAGGRTSGNPSSNPTNNPSSNPANNPSGNPSNNPTGRPSNNPSSNPSNNPTGNSSANPANNRPANPSNSTSGNPSGNSASNNPTNNNANGSPNNTTNRPSGNSSNGGMNNSTDPSTGSSARTVPDGTGNPNKPSGNSSSNEPPNMGRAPKKLDGIGRMDLRVVDQNGNPVEGARGRLSTTRPNGIFCDCWETTNAAGRAVMPPIHVGEKLKLEVKAPGYETFEQIVPGEQLAEPFRVTLQKKGGKLAHAAFNRYVAPPTANTTSAPNAPPAAGACFDLYRLFVAYATSEMTLARADFNSNRLAAAQAHYRNVLDAADTNAPAGKLTAARLFRAVSRTSLGDIALRQSRFADAVKLYEQAAEIARQDGRAELTWSAERGLGKAYWVMAAVANDERAAAKQRDASIKHYRAALDIIETLFAGSLRADDARSKFLATTKDVFDEASGVLAELALANASAAPASRNQAAAHAANPARTLEGQSLAYAAEAFRIVEQGKARSLLDMLGEARAEVREGVPAALVERKAANMARQQEIANLLGGATRRTEATAQTVEELEAELERLTNEFNSLENEIRTSSPRYAALVRAQPLTLAEVQQKVLDDATVLLEYNLGAQQSYLFAATKTGLTVHRLPARAQVERQAIELRQQLIPAGVRRAIAGINVEETRGLTLGSPSTASANVAAYVTASHALYQTVVAPAIAVVGERRILVVADGALNYVPFESLVTTKTGADYSTLSYLVKTNELVYAPSASVVAALRQAARGSTATRRGGMLLVADPVFDAGDARVKNAAQAAPGTQPRGLAQRLALKSALADVTNDKSANLKLVRLDGTRSEAEEIAKLARASGGEADVWLDFEADEANLAARKLDNYRVLHFATHGLLNAERPQFTGLALSLVGQRDGDGFLRVDEVFNLRLGSPLVMLSACETGLGKERRGEGVIGLTRAFMYAGAPTVGVSLWSVGDRSTAELMPEFYRRLLAGQGSASAAMRASQLSMIAGKRYSAPFYWAPFVLVGDWR